jgi:hypothetical protein
VSYATPKFAAQEKSTPNNVRNVCDIVARITAILARVCPRSEPVLAKLKLCSGPPRPAQVRTATLHTCTPDSLVTAQLKTLYAQVRKRKGNLVGSGFP